VEVERSDQLRCAPPDRWAPHPGIPPHHHSGAICV